MATLNEIATGDVIKQRLGPALEEFDEKVRQGKRALTRARHATEDGVGVAVTHIRRHPLRTVALAAGVGAFIGAVFGLVWGRLVE